MTTHSTEYTFSRRSHRLRAHRRCERVALASRTATLVALVTWRSRGGR